eukprot:3614104-Rhodomonas_salina.1
MSISLDRPLFPSPSPFLTFPLSVRASVRPFRSSFPPSLFLAFPVFHSSLPPQILRRAMLLDGNYIGAEDVSCGPPICYCKLDLRSWTLHSSPLTFGPQRP